MSWWAIWVMVGGSFFFKVLGVMGLARATDRATARVFPLTALIPAALFGGLVAVQTVEADGALQLDARLWGVCAGTVAVWRKAPFVVVVVVAMTVTSFVRWQTVL